MHVITGMHRSGTSFLAQVFHELGADFGPPELLFPADSWNQKGYFENMEVVDINNRLILGDGARIDYWTQAPERGVARAFNSVKSGKWKYFLFPSVTSISKRAEKYNSQIRRLHDTYQGQYVKDPRFCLTLPSWTARGPVDRLIFSYRNPGSVAASIRKRERLPMAFGFRYWLYHIRSFVRSVPVGKEVFLVDFNSFFDPQTQSLAFSRIADYVGWPEDKNPLLRLSRTLDPKLRSHVVDLERAPRAAVQAYRALVSLHDIEKADPVCLCDHTAAVAAILNG